MPIERTKISIIIPTYNEELNVLPCYDELRRVVEKLEDCYDFEFLFCDNSSSDRTVEILLELCQKDPRVRLIKLSKNFGYQRSIYTAYINCFSDAAVQFDCDLEDPPEMIPEFLEYWERGFKVVYGIRKSRNENALKTFFRKIFYRVISFLSESGLPLDAGDFRLVDRQIIDNLKMMNDKSPYLRGAIAEMGFAQIGLPYRRRSRTRGRSKFGFISLMSLAMDGITNHSIMPLRISSYFGLFLSVLMLFSIVVCVLGKLLFGTDWPAGFATTTILILFSLCLNSLFLGIIGEYLGRVFVQLKRSHVSIVEWQYQEKH